MTAMSTSVSRPAVSRRRLDASMSLLSALTEDALEPAYADAAAHRSAAPLRGRRARPSLLATLGALAVGGLLAVAFAQGRASAPAVAQEREQLVARIAAGTAQTDAEQARLQRLRAEVARQRDDALRAHPAGAGSAAAAAAAARLGDLELATGSAAVTGPGIVITLDDAAGAEGTGTTVASGPARILDTDLQRVVNGLWAAGAEAVAVNGQRLTATTAIRSAGEAVLVAYRPLSPPYDVSAVGDPGTLEADFVDGPGGRWVTTLQRTLGISVDVRSSQRLDLPAAPTVRVSRATPAPSAP